MASFFNYHFKNGTGERLTGFQRYQELISRDLKYFLTVNLLTLLSFLPFAIGVLIAILSSSVLILIPACIIGGIMAGPALSCLHDLIFRSLRDASGKCLDNYKRAWKQNWRQSIVPGVLFCLILGFYVFMLMLFWWASKFPSLGTLTIYFVGLILFTMFFSLLWPQIALFEQSAKRRFQNCLLFMIQFFWKTLGCSLIQILYWTAIGLIFPWSVILLPFLGIWFILFTADFILYDTMNEAFQIEEQIGLAFPEQVPFYESDEDWLKRKQIEKITPNSP